MADYYNLTEVFAANDWYEMGKATNDLTGGILFPGLLAVGFVVLFVAMIQRFQYEVMDALVVSSFITMVLSISMSFIDMVTPVILYFTIIPFAGIWVFYMLKER